MGSNLYYTVAVILTWMQSITSMSLKNKHTYFMDNSGSDSDIADFIVSKGYLPNEKDLQNTSTVKSIDNDVTYLLSKLSDEELVKLLKDKPKKNNYDLNDIVKAAVDSSSYQDNKPFELNYYKDQKKRFRTVSENVKAPTQAAFFRLEDKQVDPYSVKNDVDPTDSALQKLNNLLYSRPYEDKSDENDEKKEILFDILVSELKRLCCKKKKSQKKQDINNVLDIKSTPAMISKLDNTANEYMFLIMNDEIKSNGSDEIISVDPESLERNSSVLLLGPITTPLTDGQLKSVMDRISKELSKPDYLTLLQQLADGTLSANNIRLMKNLVTGPETRRYVKPHRCNHQSKLAKVYGGPKWLICTGYLNLNTPSLYD